MTIEFATQQLRLEYSHIVNFLPDWKTSVQAIEGEDLELKLKLQVAINSEAEVKSWISDLQRKNEVAYSIVQSKQGEGFYVKFKQRLYCRHNTRTPREYIPGTKNRTRNTNCPSKIIVTLRAIKKRYRGKPDHAPNRLLPCEIHYFPNHNHTVASADALRFRPVSEEVKQKLIDLFSIGHTPSTALESLKMDIVLHNTNYERVLADRYYCPDYRYCYNVFNKEFKKKYGPREFNVDAKEFISKRLMEYNEKMGECCAKVLFLDSSYIVCLCPPLMKRAHQLLQESGEIVFMDSTGTCDADGSRIFILLTHSECGGVPLGVIITSTESTFAISKGFELLIELGGCNIFFGNVNGPKIFLTDDSTAEQIAIKTIWPKSKCLLCIFHVLKAVWRWLLKTKNGIPQDARHNLYQQFRSILYSKTICECESNYKNAVEAAVKYPNYEKYLHGYWLRRDMWVLCYRTGLPVRQNHTNNNSESAMNKILKDNIFQRVKAFNIMQMLDFVMTKFVKYYEMRLLDAAHNRLTRNILAKRITLPPPKLLTKIQILSEQIVLVPSENIENNNLFYIVNTDVLLCTCIEANGGKVCKHIDWAWSLVKPDGYVNSIDSEHSKQRLCLIATGTESNKNWLKPLTNSNVPSIDSTIEMEMEVDSPISEINTGIETDNFKEKLKDLKVNATSTLNEIMEILYKHVEESPEEMSAALRLMKSKTKKMGSSECATACANFGTDMTSHCEINKIS